MPADDFDLLLNLVTPLFMKKDTHMKKSILAGVNVTFSCCTDDSFTVPIYTVLKDKYQRHNRNQFSSFRFKQKTKSIQR